MRGKCQTPSLTKTDNETRPFVCLSVASIRGVHPMVDEARCFIEIYGGSSNKYTKFGQFIIRKLIKIIADRCHIFMLKCT